MRTGIDSNKHRAHILSRANSEPQSIWSLMEGVGVWDSLEACDAAEYLEAEGFIKEHHREGPFFQHRYFIKV